MKRLANLVRGNALSLEAVMRGPKKKGQAAAVIESNEIINIFKDREDPDPRDIKQYPIYVQQLSKGSLTIHELLYGAQVAIPALTPEKANYKSFLRGIKRQRFKAIRNFKQMDTQRITDKEIDDVHERTTVYDYFNKTKEEKEEERKQAEAAMMEEDDDDDF